MQEENQTEKKELLVSSDTFEYFKSVALTQMEVMKTELSVILHYFGSGSEKREMIHVLPSFLKEEILIGPILVTEIYNIIKLLEQGYSVLLTEVK